MFVEIITPDQKLFDGNADAVTVPGTEGSLGILNKHAPMIASLKKGQIKVSTAGEADRFFEINGGVAEVLNNKVIVLVD